MGFAWEPKDPSERYEYEHDWSERLLVNGADAADEILLNTDPVVENRPTLAVTEGDVTIIAIVAVPQTNRIKYWLGGGTEKSKLTATVHTQQGRIYQESFILPIRQR